MGWFAAAAAAAAAAVGSGSCDGSRCHMFVGFVFSFFSTCILASFH